MKFKLDENLGTRAWQKLNQAGLDVCTVPAQSLQGSPDTKLIQICGKEQRCLITLDLDFANPIHFPPNLYHGIIVCRVPKPITWSALDSCLDTIVAALANQACGGKLWIVSDKQLRIYQPSFPD